MAAVSISWRAGEPTHSNLAREICERTGYAVTAVDYDWRPNTGTASSTTPWRLFVYVAGNAGQPVILSGDSAGGNLARPAVAMGNPATTAPGRQDSCLIYPLLGADTSKAVLSSHARQTDADHADMLYMTACVRRPATSPEIRPFVLRPLCRR